MAVTDGARRARPWIAAEEKFAKARKKSACLSLQV
jgi:hypothetical protein